MPQLGTRSRATKTWEKTQSRDIEVTQGPKALPKWAVADIVGTYSNSTPEVAQTSDRSAADGILGLPHYMPESKLDECSSPTHSMPQNNTRYGAAMKGKRCEHRLCLSGAVDTYTGSALDLSKYMSPTLALPSSKAKAPVCGEEKTHTKGTEPA